MRKGISPIVAVVLLIAIAVIAAVGLYFWVGGLATKQPTPSTPGVISAICSGSQHIVTISNTGASAIDATSLLNSMSTGSITTTGNGATTGVLNTCTSATMASGATCNYGNASASAIGVVYGPAIGQAPFNC